MPTIIPDRPADAPTSNSLVALAHRYVAAREDLHRLNVAAGLVPVEQPVSPAWCVVCGRPNDPFRADRCWGCGHGEIADTREMMRRRRNQLPAVSSGVSLFHGPHAASGSYCTACGWEGPCEACADEARWRSC